MTLTGTVSGSTVTDPAGNYSFTGLPSGGTYAVTPTKTALAPGSAGINTLGVIAAQKQFLNTGTPLTGCRLNAADASPVNGDGAVNTLDVVAIQRFFTFQTTGLGRCGRYQFTPASNTYTAITTNQTAQNYSALVFGDTAGSPFVHRPEGPSDNEMSAGEAPITVAAVSLPEVAVAQSKSDFIEAVKTTEIDANNKLVGFQGDLTFDERVITFQSEPVSNAGLTADNWNVSGNVLPGVGPIRTLRISAYSNDFTPLAGSGTLFDLNMRRVSPGVQSTPLIWAEPPDNFIFIDADLSMQRAGNTAPGRVTISGKRQ
jgi:hypothetical protein